MCGVGEVEKRLMFEIRSSEMEEPVQLPDASYYNVHSNASNNIL